MKPRATDFTQMPVVFRHKIVDAAKAHCKYIYFRANRCSAFNGGMFALWGWTTEEIAYYFYLNSIKTPLSSVAKSFVMLSSLFFKSPSFNAFDKISLLK